MKKGFRGKFLRWFRIWCQNWCFCFFKWYKRRKRWILSKIKHLEMMHIILLPPLPNVKTWSLTLDSEKAWKFIPKNLLHTSVHCCFRPKQLLFVKISENTIRRKMTYFHRVPDHKRHFWRWIRVQRKNLPQNSYSIRLLSLFSGDTATLENFEISKSRGLVILTTGLTRGRFSSRIR